MVGSIKKIWKNIVKLQNKFVVSLLIFSLLISQFSFLVSSVYAASSPWTQTDWSGGVGTSTTNQYSSASNITDSTAGQATLTNTEKLSNTGFETDLTSWSEVPSYTLNDQFTTDRAAGAVNGTSAEPTGGTRTVVDTENKISISSSQLTFAGGKTSPAWGDPQISYSSVSRTAGKILYGKMNLSNTSGDSLLGFGRGASGYDAGTIYFASGGDIFYYEDKFARVGTFAGSTDYHTAVVLRGTGAYHFIRGGAFTNWTLLYVSQGYSVTPLYPNVKNFTGVSTADNIRIPTSTWLPTPLAYDTFTRADGAIGTSETTGPDSQTTPSLTWTGGAISGNKVVITPSGNDITANVDLEAPYTDGLASGWTKIGSPTLAEENIQVHSGSSSQKISSSVLGDGVRNYTIPSTVGNWYHVSTWGYLESGNATIYARNNGSHIIKSLSNGEWEQIQKIERHISGTWGSYAAVNGVSTVVYLDDTHLKELTLSSLFSSVSTSDSDVIADAEVTLTAGTQAGLVLNLDSASTPANFVIAYHDGTNVKLEKNVAGTYTTVQSTAVTYVAGATLRVIKDGTKYRVYYNNVQVGSEQTVSDAGIISNTKHGLFSTYSGNSFDNFTLWARGTGAEYTSAPFEELTATRDTGTKYAGTASVQLVAGGTDANYLQSVNVGDTNSYNLSTNAYTDGSAVSSSDLELYYNGSTISTTYTSAGGGWYQLTGTLTGANASRDFGVRVKAGKTVYVDDVSLNRYETSGTLTSSIFDSGFAGGAVWGTLAFTATTPTNTTATVKVRSSNSASMTGATAFSGCTAITSGSDISSNSCVTDSDRYLQYEVTLSTTDTLVTPTFTDISTTFETYDSVGPVLELDSPGDKSYANSERPTFKWKAATDAISEVTDYDLTIDNPSLGPGQAAGDFTITDIPVSRTTDYETAKYIVHYDGFSDSDANNNYISVYTRSTSSGQASSWSTDSNSGQNDGKVREGIVNWTVKATDSVGNETSSSRTLFVDRTNPKVELTQVNEIATSQAPRNDVNTTDRTPTIYGKITDPLAGGDPNLTQDENGPRVASGPKQVDIKVEKKEGLLYKLHTTYTINMDKSWWECDNTEITDNTKQQKCDPSTSSGTGKYLPFEYTQKEGLDLGTYRITVTGKDKADNPSTGSGQVLFLTITTLDQIITPEEKEIVEEEIKDLPQEEQEQVREELEITRPVEPSTSANFFGSLIGFFRNLFNSTGNGIQMAFNWFGDGVRLAFNAAGNALAFVGRGIGNSANAVGQGLAFVMEKIGDGISDIAQGSGNMLASIGQGIGNFGKAIGNRYNQLANNAPGFTKTILTGIGNGVSTTANFIASTTNTVVTTTVRIAQNTGKAIVSSTNYVVIGTATFAKNAGLAIASATQNGVNNTKNGIANLAFTIGERTEDISHGVGTVIIKIGYLFVSEPTTISNVKVAKSTATTMTITWETNHPANGKVNYGLTADYGQDVQSEKRITNHEFTVTGLEPNTTYYYEVMSHNRNYVYDANHTFTTPAE